MANAVGFEFFDGRTFGEKRRINQPSSWWNRRVSGVRLRLVLWELWRVHRVKCSCGQALEHMWWEKKRSFCLPVERKIRVADTEGPSPNSDRRTNQHCNGKRDCGGTEPNSRDQTVRSQRGQENSVYPVQLTTGRIGNHATGGWPVCWKYWPD